MNRDQQNQERDSILHYEALRDWCDSITFLHGTWVMKYPMSLIKEYDLNPEIQKTFIGIENAYYFMLGMNQVIQWEQIQANVLSGARAYEPEISDGRPMADHAFITLLVDNNCPETYSRLQSWNEGAWDEALEGLVQ